MPPKKKATGYMIFVSEWQIRKGEPNLERAVKLAAKDWDDLTEEAKNLYKEEAKSRNAGHRGRSLDILPPKQAKNLERIAQQENTYDEDTRAKMVENFCARPIEELINTDIYVISFNVAVKTKQNEYIPIEVGIVRFNLKEGIKDAYHEFVDGGRTPIGHGFEVKEHMDRIHKIPLYDVSEYPVSEMAATESQEDHIASLKNSIAAINKFVRAERIIGKSGGVDGKTTTVQPLFTLPDLDGLGLIQTSGCLKRMASEVDSVDFFENYQVLDLTYLLFCLYRRVTKAPRPLALCTDDFFRVIHSYEPYTNCEFHETTDTPHCALSRSYRFSYVFLDVLIPVFEIKVTSAHRPKPTKPVSEVLFAPMEPRYQSQIDRVERRARSKGTFWSDL